MFPTITFCTMRKHKYISTRCRVEEGGSICDLPGRVEGVAARVIVGEGAAARSWQVHRVRCC